ncbi:PilN domain-containing protein [Lichenicoccus roseus]|uniref:PilN domain-containing protein n=1 Tax=Lichenicoccus roseus TaxID=2683649 RepID=A0A5R9J1B6_9PROT|nr:PilN domain-containing protein [Lichenicoccus roseus]TLU71414.1 PilN domain-containing protein [Lichenicoccus roseus]
MISEVLSWYAQQMRGLVPARLAAADPADVNALLVTPRPGQEPPTSLAVSLRRNDQETLLGMHQAGDTTLQRLRAEHPAAVLLLRLSQDALLVRDVSLPIAAEAEYERVLGYEMDRLTPFSAADVFWTAHVLRRNRAAGRLDLRLHLVPRAWVAGPLALMQEAGLRPAAIEAAGIPPLRIALAHDTRHGSRERLKLRVAAGACAVLAVLAIALPFVLQSAASARVERRITALQPQVAQVQALRRTLLAGSAGADAIAAARRRLGDPLQLMASLTRVLPDDTYLSDLALRAGILTLTGQSASAVRLIPALSADPAFAAPAFSAPVTRIEASNTDLFSIRARVAAR